MTERGRWPSVMYSDQEALEYVLTTHAPRRRRSFISDVTYGGGVMWQGVTRQPDLALDIGGSDDPSGPPFIYQADYTTIGDDPRYAHLRGGVDLLVFDPPHAMDAGKGLVGEAGWGKRYGTRNATAEGAAGRHNSVAWTFEPFLAQATVLLARRGVIAAKIGDQTHGGCNQWEHCQLWATAKRMGLVPCDYVIVLRQADKMRDPRWKVDGQQHADKVHALWLVIRRGKNHEPLR